MNSQINLTAIFISNGMALGLFVVMFYGNRRMLMKKSLDTYALLAMMFVTFVSCVLDPLIFLSDGKPGLLNRIINVAGNDWLFFTNLVVAPAWEAFICFHLNVKYSKAHMYTIFAGHLLGIIMLIVNAFYPVVFYVDEANVYTRCSGFYYYLVYDLAVMVDSLVVYFYARRQGGFLKFFPVWAFIVPAFAGIALQSYVYGISTIWPGVAISMTGVMAGINNEASFRDELTGLYNRYYLDDLKREIGNRKDAVYTAVMLDLNGFKVINDTLGHRKGDEALIETAKLLRNAVGNMGIIIRYAGDEFICLLNTRDGLVVENSIHVIKKSFEKFNADESHPYKLSASYGICTLSISDMTVDAFMNEVDRRMYEDKRHFYQSVASEKYIAKGDSND